MPPTPNYDVIVIGGGPAGSTAAALTARQGLSTLVLEREVFPRFKVGESLIPASYDTFERLGLLDALRSSAFPKKHSVQFFLSDGRATAPFYFHETEPGERSQTWQVLRSELDQMLLDNARREGAEVREGITVKRVLFDGDPAHGDDRAYGVATRPRGGGPSQELHSRVVIDASGQRSLISRRLGLLRHDPELRMAAIFTHFEGGWRGEGIDEGATLILHTVDRAAWFWFIPLPQGRVSVGVVGPIEHLIRGRGGDPEQTFHQELARCPALAKRLQGARQLQAVQVLNDFSYRSRQAAGDGWVLAGDAYGFLDPMYSTGLFLALKSGEMAADAVAEALAADDPSGERLGVFEPSLAEGMEAFRKLVYAFYNREFSFGRFLKRHPEHRLAIVDILVGRVFDRDFTTLFADMERMFGAQTVHVEAPAVGSAA